LAGDASATAAGLGGERLGSVRGQRRDAILRRSLAAADVTSLAAACAAVAYLIAGASIAPGALVGVPLLVLAGKVTGLYDRDEVVLRVSTLDEAPALLQQATLYGLVAAIAPGWLFVRPLSGVELLWFTILLLLGLCGARSLTRAAITRRLAAERCLLIGKASLGHRLQRSFDATRSAQLVAHFPLRHAGNGRGQALQLELAGAQERLRQAIVADDVQRVIVGLDDSTFEEMLEAIPLLRALGVKVSVVPHLLEVVACAVEFEDLHGLPILGIRRVELTRSSALLKRAFDLVGAAVGLILLAPVLVAIALGVRVSSPGPVFFRQRRIGRAGRPFQIVKFRTMYFDADERHPELAIGNRPPGLFKLANDPRVTPLGRFLRRTSLDELPQLVNVLAGRMSLVGPRPLIAEEEGQVPAWARRRLTLTPGITGNWQVLAATRVPLSEMVKIDYLYIANWSLWWDVKILLRTGIFMLAGRGL
jgi:exopolysaccharide biosynthesis polyprenyl glycosylphosphotransferase